MPGAFGWDDHGCAGQTLPIALGLSDSYLKQLRKTLSFALSALAGPFAKEKLAPTGREPKEAIPERAGAKPRSSQSVSGLRPMGVSAETL